jgi:hypothetical protein
VPETIQEKLLRRVGELEKDLSTLFNLIQNGSQPAVLSLYMLTQELELVQRKLKELEDRVRIFETEDKKLKNQTLYLLIILILTHLLGLAYKTVHLDWIKQFLGF